MKLTSGLLIFAFLLFLSCSKNKMTFDNALCIENISIIDPVNGLKANQTVILKDGKIFKVESTSNLILSSDNEIIDGTGKFLIPGLWDAHVHFAFLEELAPSMFDLFLAYGITSVRDTGGKFEFVKKYKDLSLRDPLNSPRVMIAGPLLDGMPNVYDGSDLQHPELSVGLATEEDVISQISKLDSLGVDLLKAYEMLTPEQFEVLAKYGKKHNLKVTGHVPLSMDVISASNAGLSSLEHLRNLELSCASNADELWEKRKQILKEGKNEPGGVLRSKIHTLQRKTAVENYDDKKADEVLAVMAKNETWQIPTLALNTAFTKKHFTRDDFQKSFEYLPVSIEKQWKESIKGLALREATAFNIQYTEWKINMVRKIHETGIDIMAGTDCPIFFLTPGLSLHEELAILVESGLTPLEALKTATYNPAKYFNLENELGQIDENYWADLIILDANPLEAITNTTKINAVIKQGNLFSKEDINSIFERLDNQ